jgi:hypothetical protein
VMSSNGVVRVCGWMFMNARSPKWRADADESMRTVWADAGACSWIALALPDGATPGASFFRRKGDHERSRTRLDMVLSICVCESTG